MAAVSFDPPGGLTDLPSEGLARWNSFISDEIDLAAAGPPSDRVLNDSPRAQFYNPAAKPTAADAQEKGIFWFAFPRLIKISPGTPRQHWETADSSRDRQDEYCEWA